MYFLILLPALLLAGAGVLLRRRSQTLGNVLIGIACVGCLGAIVWQARETVFSQEAEIPPQDALILNSVFSGVVQQGIIGKSGIVLLVFPDDKVFKEQALEDYRDAFRGILLRGHPELDVETARLKPGSATPADFKAAVSKTKNVIAVVSYAGIPADIGQAFNAPNDPLLFVFDPKKTTDWLAPLKAGTIRSVIVPRPDVDPATAAGLVGMPMENFGKLYYMATPANADQIAAKMTAK